jgi:hypothetical protein
MDKSLCLQESGKEQVQKYNENCTKMNLLLPWNLNIRSMFILNS